VLQQVLSFFNSAAGGALIAVVGSIIGFFISFLTQSWLEKQKFERSLKLKSWENKVEKLRQFSEDLELWLYLVSLESKSLRKGDHLEELRITGSVSRSSEIQELTKKLIKAKTHLMQFPGIFDNYQKIADLIEWREVAPPYLEPKDIAAIKSLLVVIQNKLGQEIATF
jgi:hypothetical protein